MATALLIAFFLSLQVGSVAHELHEEENHGQDCFVCHVVSDEAEFLINSTPIVEPKPKFVIVPTEDFQLLAEDYGLEDIQSRAPPPRGPPATRI